MTAKHVARPCTTSAVSVFVTGGLLSVFGGAPALAATALDFTLPAWSRPTTASAASAAMATYQEWDNFTSAAGPNIPDVGNVNPNGVGNVFDINSLSPATDTGTHVISTGNLYNGSASIRLRTVVPNYNVANAAETIFHLNVRSRGTDLFDDDGSDPHVDDFSRLFINGTLIASIPSFVYTPLYRVHTGTNSDTIESSFDFALAGNTATYNIDWTTPRGSCSQDEISVDTLVVVPEPMTGSLIAVGVALAANRRRRRTVVA